MMSRCQTCRRDLYLTERGWVHPDREGLERHAAAPGRASIGALPRVDPDHIRQPHPPPIEPAHWVPVSSLPRSPALLARNAAGDALMRPRDRVWACRAERALGHISVGHPSREEYRVVECHLVTWTRPPDGVAAGFWIDGKWAWGIVVTPGAPINWVSVGARRLKEVLCVSTEPSKVTA